MTSTKIEIEIQETPASIIQEHLFHIGNSEKDFEISYFIVSDLQ